MGSAAAMPRAFLDVEVDPEKCGKVPYERGVAFVKAQAELYGLSSSVLTELPPEEVERLPELYASDFEWSEKGPVVWELAPSRIVVKLFQKESPAAVENFLGLCAGKGKSKNSGKELHYKDTPIHRVVKGRQGRSRGRWLPCGPGGCLFKAASKISVGRY